MRAIVSTCVCAVAEIWRHPGCMPAPRKCTRRIAVQQFRENHMTMIDNAALLSEKDAARLLAMSVRTLQAWRGAGNGPPYIKIGRSIRYKRSELLAWIECQRQ